MGNVWCQASQSYSTYYWYGFGFTDNSGTRHSFPNATMTYPICGTSGQTASDTSADGYTLTASVNTSTWAVTTTVHAPDGTVFNGVSGTGNGTLTDRNSNVISVAGGFAGNYTDTLNIIALEIRGSGSTTTYTYNGECGSMCEAVTETTTNYYVATAFASGCSGATDYVSSSTYPVPTKFSLPDGSNYTLTWEQTPGKSTSYITGRIKSITLPTGGTITFTYTGSNNGMNCDRTTAGMTVATPDGTWTYTHSAPGAYNVASTTVADPAGNVTNYKFYMSSSLGALETQRQVNTGSGTLLYTDVICYNGQTSNCATAPNSITAITSIAAG